MLFWQMPLPDHAMHCNEVFNGVVDTLDNTRSTGNRAIQFIFKYIKKREQVTPDMLLGSYQKYEYDVTNSSLSIL